MKLNYSSFAEANFGWIKKFLMGFLIITLFDLLVILYGALFEPGFSWDIGLLSLCFLILVTIYLGYYGLRQATVYLPKFLVESEVFQIDNTGRKSKLNLSSEELEEIKNKLDEVFFYEKPYLEQELTLNALAELVHTSDKKLSIYLNHSLHTSFYDFVNRYRVEEFKEKLNLEEYEKYSLLGVAYICGFNSKSSFYRAFRKETGISPTMYKKEKTS